MIDWQESSRGDSLKATLDSIAQSATYSMIFVLVRKLIYIYIYIF